MRELDIIAELRDTPHTSPLHDELLDELQSLIVNSSLWHHSVASSAEKALGPSIHNPKGRYYQRLNRRIGHAMRVWRSRYDGLTPAQEEYAGQVLAWAISSGAESAKRHAGGSESPIAFVLASLDRVVHDDSVHEGFKRRMDTVDVSAQLAEVLGE